MDGNPYRIDGPALISFSGGRTSAYMLWHILDGHGGQLPDDVHVCFANTGKEREETLRFVHECETRWSVRLNWLEWQDHQKGAPPQDRFKQVCFLSASRNGEPFSALIAKYGYPPTARGRYCTSKLKIETMKHFMLSLGRKRWINPIGLRFDEMRRVFKAIARNESGKERWTTTTPLASARVTRADVLAWWDRQPFDLELDPHEGNCDLCFLKGSAILRSLIRSCPSRADWWIEQEERAVARNPERRQFNPARSFQTLREEALTPDRQLSLIDPEFAPEHDAECGLWCAGEAA